MILAEEIEPRRLFDLTMRLRHSQSLTFEPATGAGVKNAFKALKRGEWVGVAVDRAVQGNGLVMDFLGEPALMPVGAAELALRTGATLVPSISLRAGFEEHVVPHRAADSRRARAPHRGARPRPEPPTPRHRRTLRRGVSYAVDGHPRARVGGRQAGRAPASAAKAGEGAHAGRGDRSTGGRRARPRTRRCGSGYDEDRAGVAVRLGPHRRGEQPHPVPFQRVHPAGSPHHDRRPVLEARKRGRGGQPGPYRPARAAAPLGIVGARIPVLPPQPGGQTAAGRGRVRRGAHARASLPVAPVAALRFSKALNVGTFHAYVRRSRGYRGFRPLLKRWVGNLHGRIAVSKPAAELIGRYYPRRLHHHPPTGSI